MRVAIVYPNLNLAGSLERYSVLLARSLASAGVEVHCYCNPRTSRADLPGVTLHHVRPLTSSRSRLGYPISSGSFALAATRALRRERARYDIHRRSSALATAWTVTTSCSQPAMPETWSRAAARSGQPEPAPASPRWWRRSGRCDARSSAYSSVPAATGA